MTAYFRPLVMTDFARPNGALALAGGWTWFDRVEVLSRDAPAQVIAATDLPADVRQLLTAPRVPVAGVSMDVPQMMGILNVTPDSFSDGGDHADAAPAVARAIEMQAEGAALIDIGGESTRPGAAEVSVADEIARVVPVIAGLRGQISASVSIDTRKAAVGAAALEVGAALINDVAAFTFDPDLGAVAAQAQVPVCLMHAQGDPATMQKEPKYDNVLLDVYDFLAARVVAAEAMGIPRAQIIVDPGIGFGKTVDHNLTLLRGLSLFHGLGCPLLLGASRKRFIGTLGHAPDAKDRMPGSVSVALHAVRQGVQILRVHDTKATKQALDLQMALAAT